MATSFFGGEFFGGEFFNTGTTPPTPPTPVITVPGGVRKGGGKRYRVRRADFSSQKAYEFALRQALLESNFGVVPDDIETPARAKAKLRVKGDKAPQLPDTAIELSATDMAMLQAARQMEEMALLELFINIIEEEDC